MAFPKCRTCMYSELMADPNSAMNDTNLSKIDHSNNLTHIACVVPNGTPTQVAETMVCALIFLTSLIGNALVVSVVYRERRMRTSVNFLITNLAVSDFLCSTLVIPKLFVEIFYYKDAWLIAGSLGAVSCKTVYFLLDVSVAVSLLSLLYIAIERYTAISTPLPADTTPRRRCKAMIISTWLIACVMYSTYFYTFNFFVKNGRPYCHQSWKPLVKNDFEALKIELTIRTTLLVFIPFVVIVTLYSSMLLRIRRTCVPCDASDSLGSIGQKRWQIRNRKVLRMMLTVLFAYGFCWFPCLIYIFVVVYAWSDKKLEPPCLLMIFGKYTFYLAFANPSINPIIYFMFSENYKNGLRKLIGQCLGPPSCYTLKISRTTHRPAEIKGTTLKRKKRHPVNLQHQDIELRVLWRKNIYEM